MLDALREVEEFVEVVSAPCEAAKGVGEGVMLLVFVLKSCGAGSAYSTLFRRDLYFHPRRLDTGPLMTYIRAGFLLSSPAHSSPGRCQ